MNAYTKTRIYNALLWIIVPLIIYGCVVIVKDKGCLQADYRSTGIGIERDSCGE